MVFLILPSAPYRTVLHSPACITFLPLSKANGKILAKRVFANITLSTGILVIVPCKQLTFLGTVFGTTLCALVVAISETPSLIAYWEDSSRFFKSRWMRRKGITGWYTISNDVGGWDIRCWHIGGWGLSDCFHGRCIRPLDFNTPVLVTLEMVLLALPGTIPS